MKQIERRLEWVLDIITSASVNLKKLSAHSDHPINRFVKEIRTQVDSAEKILAEAIKTNKKHKEEREKERSKK